MDKEQGKIAEGLIEICNLAQEGLCLESKWGKCIFPEQDNNDGHKCGLCFAKYITEELGYRKLPGKPPILSTLDLMPHVIDAQIMGMDSNDGMLDALRLVAQAQRNSDIKWYGGKE